MAPPRRFVAAIAAETLLLLINALGIFVVLLFFMGASIPDTMYIYWNVAEFSIGAGVFAALLVYLAVKEMPFTAYCHLTPPAAHTLFHVAAFIVAFRELHSPHTDGDMVAALTMMIGLSAASIGTCLSYLHNS